MNRFVHNLIWAILPVFFVVVGITSVRSQSSVFDPNDPVVIYNKNNPPAQPSVGLPAKWVKTNRLPWSTTSFKAYIYNGIPFRLKWPKNYDASGNTKYPLFLFFHGKGERGTIYDNEYQMYHGGELHRNAVDNGKFNGFLLYPQTSSSDGLWNSVDRKYIMELIENFLIPEVHVDPFRVSVDGLSGGGLNTWMFLKNYPKLTAACLPISSSGSILNDVVIDNKFTPIWLFQGALDLNPAPISSTRLRDISNGAGGNFTYSEYPNLGHGCWYSAWNEPDYFPFINRAHKANPWPLYGRTEFCYNGPGSINTTIGVTSGFNEYQWRRNDTLITGLPYNANTLSVTDTGTYSCRIRKGTVWSEWSPIPVKIKYKESVIPPTIKVSGLMSNVLPAPDGKTTVNIEVPSGYTEYDWQKVGNPATIGDGNVLSGATVGQYKVKVTEQLGCPSVFSAPFSVVNANGPNSPDAATGLIAIPLSYTSIKLNWSANPNPVYPQTHFEIYQATRTGGPYQFISLVDGNEFSFLREGLIPGTKYYYIVRSVNNSSAAPVSNEATASTQKDSNPPSAPGNLHVTGTTRNGVGLSWDESTDDVGLDHYEIYVNGVKSYVTSERDYMVYGLEFGKTYNFSIKAVDIAGNKSAPSNQVTAQPLAKGLSFKHYTGTWDNLPNFNLLSPILSGVVPNVSLANASQSENYGFLWEGFIHIPEDGYYVFSTTSDDGSKLYLDTDTSHRASPYNHTAAALVNNDGIHSSTTIGSSRINLKAGVYPIAITFFQKTGGAAMSIAWKKVGQWGSPTYWSGAIPDSAFVDAPVISSGTAPAKPTNLTATTASHKRIDLTWTDNSSNEKSFELYRSTDSLNNFITVGVLPANTTNFADTLLEPATTYYYKIRAINQYGESVFDKSGPGVDYAYYETPTGLSILPDFNAMTPLKTGRVEKFGLGMQMRANYFALKFEGNINLSQSGTYTFYLQSDDGSKLYIDNNLVVDHDGAHSNTEKAGTPITLSAGSHTIRIIYFEIAGDEALMARYEGPGISKKEIPGNVLGDILAHATTFAGPAAPGAPDNLTAVATSASSIKVAWVNHSSNANGIELYRSYNDNENFVLLATLPSNTASFNDTELYPSSLFYYKARAFGEGGQSPYSNESNGRTLGIVPSVVPLESVYMRYNSSVDVPIEAISGTPVPITLQVSNLPSFAVFNITGNGKGVISLNPALSNVGTYNNLTITASNPDGNLSTAQFSVIVNDNYTPHITPIPDAAVQENQTLQINLSATDDDPGDQLMWSYAGLPNFATVASSNKSASITLNPKNGDKGQYRIKAYVNDGRHGKDTTSFVINVTQGAVVNPDDGTVPVSPKNIKGVFVNDLNAVKITWGNAAYNAVKNEVYRSTYMTGGFTLLNPGATANKDDTVFVDNSIGGNKTYYYLVRAVNANGGSNSLVIKVITPNRAPVVNADDIYIKGGNINDVNIISTDDPGNSIKLAVSNLPDFASFTDQGNGSGVIHMAPTGTHVGVYEGITIKATDNFGDFSTKTIKITVSDKYITSVYVNFNNIEYPISFMPWNSFNAPHPKGTKVPAGAEISNLKDEVGMVTTIDVKLMEIWSQIFNGKTTGSNTGVFPDSIMMSGYFFTKNSSNINKTIRISGLDDNMKYNLTCFASSTSGTPLKNTYYSAGGQTVSLNPKNNTTNTAKINAIAPVQGKIDLLVEAQGDGDYAVISAMVIEEYADGLVLPPYGVKTKGTKNSINLTWQCKATGLTGFEVWRSDAPNGTYTKLSGTIPGNVFSYTDAGLAKGTIYYYKLRAVSGVDYSDFSDYASGSTIKYEVNINFNDGSELGPPQSAPWNNTNLLVYEGFTLPNLLNDENQNTGINMTVVGSLNSFSGTNRQDNSLTTGNNSGAVPDIVMSTFYFLEYGQIGMLKIDGLNQTMRYNFVFYGGCKDRGKGQVTTYTIGSESVDLDAKNNTTNTVQINNVAPDETGSVMVSLTPTILSGFGYINSLSIQAVPSDMSGSNPSGRKSNPEGGRNALTSNISPIIESGLSKNVVTGTYPNPFIDDITVRFSMDKALDKVVVILRDISGKPVFSTTLANLPKGVSERKLGLKGGKLAPGIYGLQFIGLDKEEKVGVIVVK